MSFRKYGGINYSAKNNYVNSNISTSSGLYVKDGIGQYNSYVNSYSDLSSNLIIGPTGGGYYSSQWSNVSPTGIQYDENVYIPKDIIAGGGIFNSLTTFTSVVVSDYRIKENVVPLNESFNIDNIVPVTYKNTKTDRQDIGVIAHEIQEIYPYLVNGDKDGSEFQAVNYSGLIPILIKEIKDLKNEVKELKAKINI